MAAASDAKVMRAGAQRLQADVAKRMRVVDKVSFIDLAQHPRLALQARRELNRPHTSSPEREAHLSAQVVLCPACCSAAAGFEADALFAVQANAREADLARQQAAVADTEADAAEESRINVELASQLATRLDASRRASERLLGIFQASGRGLALHLAMPGQRSSSPC